MLASSFARDMFAGVVRHAATFGGGWLIAHGIIAQNQYNDWIGSICFLGGVLWSAWDKWNRAGKI